MRNVLVYLCMFPVLVGMSAMAAQADLKVVAATWVDQKQWVSFQKTLTIDERAELSRINPVLKYGAVQSAVYIVGDQMRLDTPDYCVFLDQGTGKTDVLFPKKALCVEMPHPPPIPMIWGDTRVQATSDTRVVQGHRTHRYLVAADSDGMTLDADVWAADDMSAAKFDNIDFTSNSWTAGLWRKIKGIPLAMTIVVTDGVHSLKIYYLVQSISTKPLPKSTFAIPAGYRIVVPRRPAGSPNQPLVTPGDTVGEAPAPTPGHGPRLPA